MLLGTGVIFPPSESLIGIAAGAEDAEAGSACADVPPTGSAVRDNEVDGVVGVEVGLGVGVPGALGRVDEDPEVSTVPEPLSLFSKWRSFNFTFFIRNLISSFFGDTSWAR